MTAPSLGFGPLSTEPNPCVRLWGPGPEGAKCRTCTLLVLVVRYGAGRRYYKCRMRRMSMSEATDHRVGWRACAKYEEGRDE
ncbi:MAG: hypothetical protein ABFE07_16975 [Armatimonadia bacterium]